MTAVAGASRERGRPGQAESQVHAARAHVRRRGRGGADPGFDGIRQRSDRERAAQDPIPWPSGHGHVGRSQQEGCRTLPRGSKPAQRRDIPVVQRLSIDQNGTHRADLPGIRQEQCGCQPRRVRSDAASLAQLGTEQDPRPAIAERDDDPRFDHKLIVHASFTDTVRSRIAHRSSARSCDQSTCFPCRHPSRKGLAKRAPVTPEQRCGRRGALLRPSWCPS